MDVTSPAQAKIAEEAGACAVMALERVPADIRKDGRLFCGDVPLCKALSLAQVVWRE